MHILFLTKWYPHSENQQLGVFIQKHALAVALYAQVSVLHVMKQNQNMTYNVSVTKGNIVQISVRYKSSAWAIINGYRNIKSHFIGWHQIIKFGRPHILHSHVLYGTCLATWALHLSKAIPFLYSEHWHGFADGQFFKLPFLKRLLFRFTGRHAKAITAVSPFLSQGLVQCRIKNRVPVISNVVHASASAFVLDKTKIHILSVADLVPIKNIEGVINSVAKAYLHNNCIVFHIVGNGPLLADLKQQAQKLLPADAYQFYGLLPNYKVLELINACSFVVINSFTETFSVVAAEALLSGKPLVSTRCGGNYFVDDDCGILIAPGSADALENALVEMIETYSSYNAENLKLKVKYKFSDEVIGKQFYNLYQQVLKQV